MRFLLAGIATAALAVSAAHAEPGKGQGQGGGNHHDKAAHAGKASPGKGNQDRGSADAGNANKGGPDKSARADTAKGNPDKGKFVNPVGQAKRYGGESSKGRDRDGEGRNDKGRGFDRRDDDVRVVITRDHDNRFAPIIRRRVEYRSFMDGCPPGLAKKFNGCMPPGLAKKDNRDHYYYRPDWWGFPSLRDGRYYYRDGYLLRLDAGDRIGGFIPLLGGALAIGNVWPTYYEPVPLAPYYVDYYDLGSRGSYRYADGVIYDVDPETAAIVSIAALMTGDQFRVGSAMPLGYDVYNVPYDYRDRYYDRPDAHYRYADGYIYEIDPETMLIASAISLIA